MLSSSSSNKTSVGTWCLPKLSVGVLNAACGRVDELDGVKSGKDERSIPRGGGQSSASSFNSEKSRDAQKKKMAYEILVLS